MTDFIMQYGRGALETRPYRRLPSCNIGSSGQGHGFAVRISARAGGSPATFAITTMAWPGCAEALARMIT